MKISLNLQRNSVAVSFALTLFVTGVARCDEPLQPPIQSLNQVALEGEAALSAPVSFEVKRKPLGELLQSVSKQSGISLRTTDESLLSRLVTARVQAMPLSQLMLSLEHLYGASWNKTERSFEMRSLPLSPLERLTLQSVDGYSKTRLETTRLLSEQELEDLRRDIIDEWLARDLPGLTPMPATDFSDDVQARLRDALAQNAGQKIINSYRKTNALKSPDCVLHFSRADNGFIVSLDIDVRKPNSNVTLFHEQEQMLNEKIKREREPNPPTPATPAP